MREINKHEARALIFWAAVGFRYSAGGSYSDIDEICCKLAKGFNIPYSKSGFQKGNKFHIWLTPKSANELWKSAVGQDSKVPHIVKRDLYRIRKLDLTHPHYGKNK